MFCGSLKALQPEIGNLLAFETDDEQTLTNAFNKTLARNTYLVRDNLKECWEEVDRPWDNREVQRGNHSRYVWKKQLTTSSKVDYSKLSILKSKRARMHDRSEEFYDWFSDNKADEFANSVINPVRKLAGLGCPPEKFTTNRSERTNGIVQDYINANVAVIK